MYHRRLFYFLIWPLVAVVSCLAFEFGSFFLLYLERGSAFYSKEAFDSRQAAMAAAAPRGVLTKLHPYYGYVQAFSPTRMEQSGLIPNNYGFPQYRSYAEVPGCCDFPFPEELRSRLFIIALFGNSIAHGLGDYFQVVPSVLEQLQKDPRIANKLIIVLNLAVGGHHQPQALHVLADLLAVGMRFDVVLNIATVIDYGAAFQIEKDGVAPSYPSSSVWLGMTSALERQVGGASGALISAAEYLLHDIQHVMDTCPVASCVVLLRPFAKILADVRGKNENGLQVHFFTARPRPDLISTQPHYVQGLWAKSTELMETLTRAQGGIFINALMPTPYDHPSGVQPEILNAGAAMQISATTQDYLRAMRTSGVTVLDATRVVDGIPVAAAYLDENGHFNQAGMKAVCSFLVTEIHKRIGVHQ